MLTVKYKGRIYLVRSIQDAVAKWEDFRLAALESGGGYDDIGSGLSVRDGSKVVARIAYNGRVQPAN